MKQNKASLRYISFATGNDLELRPKDQRTIDTFTGVAPISALRFRKRNRTSKYKVKISTNGRNDIKIVRSNLFRLDILCSFGVPC